METSSVRACGSTHHLPLLRGLVHSRHHLVMQKQKQRLVRHFLLIPPISGFRLPFGSGLGILDSAPTAWTSYAAGSVRGRALVARRPRNPLNFLKAGNGASLVPGRAHPRATGPAAERESLTATGTKPSPWRPDPAPRRGGENTTSGPLYPGIPPALWSQSAFPGVSCRRREEEGFFVCQVAKLVREEKSSRCISVNLLC